MSIFSWVKSLFGTKPEPTPPIKKRSRKYVWEESKKIEEKQKERRHQNELRAKGKYKRRWNNAGILKFIKSELIFEKESRIPYFDLYSRYVNFCVKTKIDFLTYRGFFHSFYYQCRNKPIWRSEKGGRKNFSLAGIGFKEDCVEEQLELGI
jgi:hypothetical protein